MPDVDRNGAEGIYEEENKSNGESAGNGGPWRGGISAFNVKYPIPCQSSMYTGANLKPT